MQTRQPPPRGVRLRRSTLLVAGGVVVLVVAGGVYLLATISLPLPSLTAPEGRKEPVVHEVVQIPDIISQRRRDYGTPAPAAPAQPVVPQPASTPPPPAAMTTQPGLVPGFPGLPAAPAALPPPDTGGAETQPLPSRGPSARPPTRQPRSAGSTTPRPPRKPGSWFTGQAMQNPNVLTSPFGDEDDTAPPTTPEGQPQARRRQPGRGTLIVPATWEAPADPTKVLYAHQVIYGLLERDMNSDAPGPISVLVTEQVEDMFGQGQVLIPQYTHLLGMEEARPTYGQERVPATFRLANFPDGRSVSFRNARAGDETGAAGIPGHVNNHWVKLGIGAVISAAVNFGVRQPFGSTEGFQPSLPQEYARDVGQGLQQPLQRAIQQKFLVPPTITQTRGFPVIIMLEENVSFMTKPVQVTK